MTRMGWDEYFIGLMHAVSQRSTCDRGMVGCVVTKSNRIVSTGYAGSPPGLPHCDDVGHQLRETLDEEGKISKHCVRTIHAEQNAIAQAARFGVSLEGTTFYIKMEPCYTCAKLIIAAGAKRVVCEKHYHAAKDSRDVLSKAGVELVVIKSEEADYSKL